MVAILYVAEFVGTFLLAMTAGFCEISLQKWAMPWALASMTVALTYALEPVTNGHFNPAVCVGIGIVGKIKWVVVAGFAGVQLLAGVLAGFICTFVYGSAGELPPDARYDNFHRGGAEALYTFMLTFVILNVCFSNRSKGNEYFGLAIGLVYIAGGYAAGGISGGVLNPALAIGLRLASFLTGTGGIINALVYSLCQVIGSAAAAGAFFIVRPDEHHLDDSHEVGQLEKCACEFLGAFMITMTVGLNLLSGSTAMPWSAAACLASMTSAVGNISGAMFNPAVSLSIILSGRDKLSPAHGAIYSIVHVIAAVLAGVLLGPFHISKALILLHEGYSIWQGCLVEFLFTFILVFVFMALATVDVGILVKTDVFVSLAIGLCITAGGFAIESIVLAGFNPAVTLGATVANAWHGAADWKACSFLIVAELLGSVAAFGFFRLTYRHEFPP